MGAWQERIVSGGMKLTAAKQCGISVPNLKRTKNTQDFPLKIANSHRVVAQDGQNDPWGD